jgi:hypothetical protein
MVNFCSLKFKSRRLVVKNLAMIVFSLFITIATSQSAHAWRCSNGFFPVDGNGFAVNFSARSKDGFVIIHQGQKFPNDVEPFIYSSRSECKQAMKDIKRNLRDSSKDED